MLWPTGAMRTLECRQIIVHAARSGHTAPHPVQVLGGEAKVFGWISGDEQAVLRQHGII